jgi:hypothetical protein
MVRYAYSLPSNTEKLHGLPEEERAAGYFPSYITFPTEDDPNPKHLNYHVDRNRGQGVETKYLGGSGRIRVSMRTPFWEKVTLLVPDPGDRDPWENHAQAVALLLEKVFPGVPLEVKAYSDNMDRTGFNVVVSHPVNHGFMSRDKGATWETWKK